MKFEKGDNLDNFVEYAKKWFKDNNVKVPKLAKDWQNSSVTRGEIPPYTTGQYLRKRGISQKQFITLINGLEYKESYKHSPITVNNIKEILGLKIIEEKKVNNHRKIFVCCTKCSKEEWLDYGTLQRMRARKNKYCRYCRDVGGKEKTLNTYDNFKGFTVTNSSNINIVSYICNTCKREIRRAKSYAKRAEYLVCEHCFPKLNLGAKYTTEEGEFDSKMEYLSYLKLIEIIETSDIIRQKSYNELFNTGTKHTADFYIPKLNLVLEVTTSNNNLSNKYKETMAWKIALDPSIKFAYSIKEVEDIVRAAAKAVDYPLATAEMYVAAVLSKDRNLMQVFKDKQAGIGADFHSSIAHMVFRLPCSPEEVKDQYPQLRQAAKAISFGILYGSGPQKVADTVNADGTGTFSLDDANEAIKKYFEMFPRLKKWLADNQQYIKTNGFIYSIYDRKRRLGNVFSTDRQASGHELRSGINFLIQSVASDINLLASIEIQQYINDHNLDVEIFGLVHDSILAVVKKEDLDEYLDIAAKLTQKDHGCFIPGCPIGIDQEIGADYSFKEKYVP